ncbi:MAG: hypothetical protein K8S99_11500 [Planctomycetes bacterium]|nr:hypothetical protein [Planctomycetota bacterium]
MTTSSNAPKLRPDATPQEKADHEWEHDPQARKDFKDKAALTRYHEHVAKGRINTGRASKPRQPLTAEERAALERRYPSQATRDAEWSDPATKAEFRNDRAAFDRWHEHKAAGRIR